MITYIPTYLLGLPKNHFFCFFFHILATKRVALFDAPYLHFIFLSLEPSLVITATSNYFEFGINAGAGDHRAPPFTY